MFTKRAKTVDGFSYDNASLDSCFEYISVLESERHVLRARILSLEAEVVELRSKCRCGFVLCLCNLFNIKIVNMSCCTKKS